MKEPTMEEVLELVDFGRDDEGELFVETVKGRVAFDVKGDVMGNVWGGVGGSVWGDVWGDVWRDVKGDVMGKVWGNVKGTIGGRDWQFIETPKEKIIRLIREGKGEEAIKFLEESE
jgi:outer membrane lipoprotein SlyB